MIDPAVRNVRLFMISFESDNDDPSRDSFDTYYIPLVEIIDFNALIDNKLIFNQPTKNKQESFEKLVEMERNDDYPTGNVLEILYYQKFYKLIGIDLPRQINTSIPQQINFTGKLNGTSDSKLVTRKWSIVNGNSNANYDEGTEIICNTEVLKSNFCDWSDAYILVRGDIITKAHNNTGGFKSCAPFIKCITKIDGSTIDNAEDLYLVMLIYNLLEYSSDYSDTTGSLWFKSTDDFILKQLILMLMLVIIMLSNLSSIRLK